MEDFGKDDGLDIFTPCDSRTKLQAYRMNQETKRQISKQITLRTLVWALGPPLTAIAGQLLYLWIYPPI